MKGILGRKIGMTTIFLEDGHAVPVTVISVEKNVVLQVKNKETDGYEAIKLGFWDQKEKNKTRAELGMFRQAKSTPKRFVKEIRGMSGFELGDVISASDIFKSGQYIDVIGTSKGKGFQGSIKRHNQSRGPMSHGSKYHRGTGSSGDIRSTVKKTKKMPGRMGGERVTVQNLEIISINEKLNVLLVKGSIPGPNKSFVLIKEAIKKENNKFAISKNLVNVENIAIKNQLLEEGKKVNASLNSAMSIEKMQEIIKVATEEYLAEEQEYKEYLDRAKKLKINKANKMKLQELKIEVKKVEKLVESRKNKESKGK